MNKQRLAEIEEYVFSLFRRHRVSRLLTKEVFDSTSAYANADLVRSFEDLEKKWRLLVRYTEEGNDWLQLTPEGMRHVGLSEDAQTELPRVQPHPPKSMVGS